MTTRAFRISLGAVILVGSWLRADGLDERFERDRGGGLSALYANYGRYFAARLRAGEAPPRVYEAPHELFPGHVRRYANHPPLLLALVGLSMTAFGPSEAAARLVPLAFAALGIAAIGFVGRRVAGDRAGIAAAALAAASPMGILLGRLVEPQSQVVSTLGVLAILAGVRARERPSGGRLLALAAVLVLAGSADWIGFYAFPALWLWILLSPGPRPRSLTLGLPALGVLLLALLVANAKSPGEPSNVVGRMVDLYAGTVDDLGEWGRRAGGTFVRYYGPGALALALAGVGLLVLDARRARDVPLQITAMLLAFGAPHVFLGGFGAAQDFFWQGHLVAFVSVAGAVALDRTIAWIEALRRGAPVDAPATAGRDAGTRPSDRLALAAMAVALALFLFHGRAVAAAIGSEEIASGPLGGDAAATVQSLEGTEDGVFASEFLSEAVRFRSEARIYSPIQTSTSFLGACEAALESAAPLPRWFVVPVAPSPASAQIGLYLAERFPFESRGERRAYRLEGLRERLPTLLRERDEVGTIEGASATYDAETAIATLRWTPGSGSVVVLYGAMPQFLPLIRVSAESGEGKVPLYSRQLRAFGLHLALETSDGALGEPIRTEIDGLPPPPRLAFALYPGAALVYAGLVWACRGKGGAGR
jgi:hypothetical protein